MIRFVPLLVLAAWSPQDASPEAHVLERVFVVGASMSNGMEEAEAFAPVIDALITREHEPVVGRTDLAFFASPLLAAEKQLAFVAEQDPTLIVGADFLFWFGYGLQNADGDPIASEEERLALLEKGLSFLEPFDCPLVLGDYPDMSDAVGSMLLQGQVPEPATRVALNARLREWAAGRKNVVLLPLDVVMKKLRAGEEVTMGRHTWPADSTDVLLRPDKLHPTIEGQIAIAHLVAHELVEAEVVSPADVQLDLGALFETLDQPAPDGIGE